MMTKTFGKVAALLPAFVLLALMGGGTVADDPSWPMKISFERGSLLIYQPQIESFVGNRLEARAAISIRQGSPEAAPTFAALRFIATTDSTQNDAVLTVRELELVDLYFGDESVPQQQQLAQVVMQQLAGITLQIANDYSVVAANGDAQPGPYSLRSDPPRIILSTEPAMLVPIDGEPRLERIEGSELQWVVNSAIPIIKRQQIFYLFGGATLWYRSENVLGPWSVIEQVPDEVRQLVEEESAQDSGDVDPVPVRILVATEPTELIVSDGDPSWSPVEGMDLLFMANTESNVFLELASGDHFLLLGGRWFRGDLRQIETSWQAVANDALPAAFADIAEDSRRSEVLTHVAGTPQARAAVLQNSLPRTTAVKRGESSFEADWDGEPQFETVQTPNQDDEVLYAINTADSVFKVGETYYACEQGVWYESQSAFGPWVVATTIPDVIYTIPPSNPHHEVTYVRIYDATPQVVTVGYTPGYLGSYTHHGSVVYGTGYSYDPWIGSYYYPRGLTWGLSPFYDPWSGWSSGIISFYSPFRYNLGHRSQPRRHLRANRFGRANHGRHSQRRSRDHGSGTARENHRSTDRKEQIFNTARVGTEKNQRQFNRRDNIARLRVDADHRLNSREKKQRRFTVRRPDGTDTQSTRTGSTPRLDRSVARVVEANLQRPEGATRSQSDGNMDTVEPTDFTSRERRPSVARATGRAPQRRPPSDVRINHSTGDSRAADRLLRSGGKLELREPSRQRRLSTINRPTADTNHHRSPAAFNSRLPSARPLSLPRVATTRTAAVKKSTSKPADQSQQSPRSRSNSSQADARRDQGTPQRARNSTRFRQHRR